MRSNYDDDGFGGPMKPQMTDSVGARPWNTPYTTPLAEPEQEPVACIKTNGELMWLKKPSTIYSKPRPLYVAPPRREWVGLTAEDMADAHNSTSGDVMMRLAGFARAIEAKLKEKNT